MNRKRKRIRFAVLAVVAVGVMLVAPLIGGSSVSLHDVLGVFRGGDWDAGSRIFWQLRVPRVLLGFVAGAALSVCGMAFQSVFRNPLSDPYTLGVSGGAAFGAVLAIKLGLVFTVLGLSTVQLFACAGAMLSISLVYGISKSRRGFTSSIMLLTGVAVSFFFSALIMFLQYIADYEHSFSMVRWMMGGLTAVGYLGVVQTAVPVLIGAGVVFFKRSELNLFVTGDELAAGRGVDVERVRAVIFFSASLCAGSAVAMCGPIGFVGLIIPHMMRLVFGSDHHDLAPASIIGGGVFLVVCDTFARTVISPVEMPVGVITALLGGPFFVWLLFRNRE